ncbi:MAG: Flp family type IVb pilin [Pseudomonadota bacterium]
MIGRFFASLSGTSAIEYSIIAGLISIAIVAGVSNVGSNTGDIYDTVNTEISGAGG